MRGFSFEFGDAFKKELLDDAESDAVFCLIDAPYTLRSLARVEHLTCD